MSDPILPRIPDTRLEISIHRNIDVEKPAVSWRRYDEDDREIDDWVAIQPYNTYKFWDALRKEGISFQGNILYLEVQIRGRTGYLLRRDHSTSIQKLGILIGAQEHTENYEASYHEGFELKQIERKSVWKFAREVIEKKPGRSADELLAWLRKHDRGATFQFVYQYAELKTGRAALWVVLTTENKALEFKMRFG